MIQCVSTALRTAVEQEIGEYLTEINFNPSDHMSTYVDLITVIESTARFNEFIRRPEGYFMDSVFLRFTDERCMLLAENYRSATAAAQQMIRAGFSPIDAVRLSTRPVSDVEMGLKQSIITHEDGVVVMAILFGLIEARRKTAESSTVKPVIALPKFYSVSTVAKMLKVGRETVTSLIESGALVAFLASPQNARRPTYRVSPAALEDFQAKRAVVPARIKTPRRKTRESVEKIL